MAESIYSANHVGKLAGPIGCTSLAERPCHLAGPDLIHFGNYDSECGSYAEKEQGEGDQRRRQIKIKNLLWAHPRATEDDNAKKSRKGRHIALPMKVFFEKETGTSGCGCSNTSVHLIARCDVQQYLKRHWHRTSAWACG